MWDNLDPITFDWSLTIALIRLTLPILAPLLIAMLFLRWLEGWLLRRRRDKVVYIQPNQQVNVINVIQPYGVNQTSSSIDLRPLILQTFEQEGFHLQKLVSNRFDFCLKHPSGLRVLVVFKPYLVEQSDVQYFYNTMTEYQAQQGFFFTTNTFSFDAIAFARNKPLHLIDKNGILKRFHQLGISIPKGVIL